MRGTQIIDVSLTPGDNVAGTITPIVGIENGKQVEYDKKTSAIYWLESKGEDEDNVSCLRTTYMSVFTPLITSFRLNSKLFALTPLCIIFFDPPYISKKNIFPTLYIFFTQPVYIKK